MRLMDFEYQYSNFVGQANSNGKMDTSDYIRLIPLNVKFV